MSACAIEACERPTLAKGLCNAHYLRQKRGKPMDKPVRLYDDDEARFHEKYTKDPEGGCWVWTAYRDRFGYGMFYVDGQLTQAHRFSHQIHKGPIPKGMHTDHLCRNPNCVNPEHLEVVTAKENFARSPLHNGSKTHCPQGHAYDEQNTGRTKDGKRYCRACARIRERKKRA